MKVFKVDSDASGVVAFYFLVHADERGWVGENIDIWGTIHGRYILYIIL